MVEPTMWKKIQKLLSQRPKARLDPLDAESGDKHEWLVELDGETVGELVAPQFVDMFWLSYEVVAFDDRGARALHDADNWNQCRFRYRHKTTGRTVDTAIAGGSPPFVHEGKVLMRGLG